MSIIRVYNTEDEAIAGLTGTSNGEIPSATVDSVEGTIHNNEDNIPYYIYERYFYRIEANEPVLEFHIDWDDGEDNSEEKRNLQIIKFKTPRTFCVVDHVYTEVRTFFPLIRVKSKEGFISKLYTHHATTGFSSGRLTPLEPTTVGAGQNSFSQVSLTKADSNQIPRFIPSGRPPISILKVDRKKIFAGIDNKHIEKIRLASGYPLLYALSEMSSGTQPIVKLTVLTDQKQIREYTISAANVATADSDINTHAGATSEVATKMIPRGNHSTGPNKINFVRELLKAELLNATKLGDSERIYINVHDVTTSINSTIAKDNDRTVCVLSNGNPIVELNDPHYTTNIDGSASFTQASNIDVSTFTIDDDSLPDYGVRNSITSKNIQAASTLTDKCGNMSDVLDFSNHFSLGKPGAKAFSYTHGSHGHYKDSNSRFYNFERHIRMQVYDTASGTTVKDVENRTSFIEHYGRNTYDSSSLRAPTSLQSEAILLYSTSSDHDDTDGTSGGEGESQSLWSDIGGTPLTNQIKFGTDSGDTKITNDTTTDIDGEIIGQFDNFLLLAKTDKFNSVYFRTAHLNVLSDSAFNVKLAAWYATSSGWLPLEINDTTNNLLNSGTISWNNPTNWVQRKTSNINGGDWGGPVEEDDGTSVDPATRWDFDAYGVLIGISASSASGLGKLGVNMVLPSSNKHSQTITIMDPHHVSLNDIAIAQSISYSRNGKFTNIQDRFGKTEIRKIGSNGGQVTFGSVDLGDTDSQGNRKKMKQHQQNATPVFLDVTHQSGEKTRFYGVITRMSEDFPTGKQFPKYAIQMQVSHIIELNSSGDLLTGKISIGGIQDDARKFLQ
tara:strand:- start:1184 stop:3697 length:2514 start_codon:yes stop_codon:yes gene_type:complete